MVVYEWPKNYLFIKYKILLELKDNAPEIWGAETNCGWVATICCGLIPPWCVTSGGKTCGTFAKVKEKIQTFGKRKQTDLTRKGLKTLSNFLTF